MPLPTSSTRTRAAATSRAGEHRILRGGGPAGADVVLAEDLLVSQDAGAAVLTIVVEFRSAAGAAGVVVMESLDGRVDRPAKG